MSASDGPSLWATATNLRSDLKPLAAVRNSMRSSQTELDSAAAGFARARALLEDMRSKIVAASESGSDRAALQSDIADLKRQFAFVAQTSGIGAGWMTADLSAASATRAVAASYGSSGSSALAVVTREIDLVDLALYDTAPAGEKRGIVDGLRAMTDALGSDLLIGGLPNETGNRMGGGLGDATSAKAIVAATVDATGIFGVVASVTTQKGEDTSNGTRKGSVSTAALEYNRLKDGDVLTFKVTTRIGSTTATREAAVTYSTSASSATFNDDASLRTRLTEVFAADFVTPDVSSGRISFATTADSNGDMVRLEDINIHDADGIRRSRAAFSFSTAGAANFQVSRPERLLMTNPNFGLLEADDTIRLKININGASLALRVTGARSITDMVNALNADPTFRVKAEADRDPDLTKFVIRGSGDDWSGSGIRLEEVSFFDAAGRPKVVDGTQFKNVADFAKLTFTPFDGPMVLDGDDNVSFDLRVDGARATKVRIDRALVDRTLGAPSPARATGVIASAADYALVLRAAIQTAGITGMAVSADNGRVNLKGTAKVGSEASIQISGTRISTGGQKMSVDRIDVSDTALAARGAGSQKEIAAVLAGYRSTVQAAIERVVAAETKIAAISRGIASQSSFLEKISDIKEQAISNLVDADMAAEASRLRAVQVRQQLAIQSLSIANQSSANILKLFL